MRFPARLSPAAVVTVAALALGACASVDTGGAAGPPAPAPDYRVGDRWVYHVVDGYRAKIVWDETHRDHAIAPDGITVTVTAGIDVQCRSSRVVRAWRGAARFGLRGRDEPLRSGPRSLQVSAGDGRAVGSAPRRSRSRRRLRRHHAPFAVGGYERINDPRRNVRRNWPTRDHADGRRNILAYPPNAITSSGMRRRSALGARGQEIASGATKAAARMRRATTRSERNRRAPSFTRGR